MNEVLARLEEAFPSCVVKMNAMGSRMTLEVTSPIFKELSIEIPNMSQCDRTLVFKIHLFRTYIPSADTNELAIKMPREAIEKH